MKKTIILLSMAALVFAACQKEQPSSTGGFELTATVEQQDGAATKTSLDANLVKWSAGDNVDVWTNAATPEKLTLSLYAGDGDVTGYFSSPDTPSGTPVYALYPSSASSSISGSTISFTIQENQTYAAGSFGPGANVAVATISGKNMSFKNVCGVLRLQLKGNFAVEKIVLTGKNGEYLCGDFTVDASSSNPVAAYSANGGTAITLNCPDAGIQLNATTATDFYIVLPAGAMDSGFDADIYSTTDSILSTEISTDGSNTIVRSLIKVMPAITVLPPMYQKVASLSSDGTQYIYTGLTPYDYDAVEGAEPVVSNDSVYLFKGKTEVLGTVTFKKDGDIVHQFVPCYLKNINKLASALSTLKYPRVTHVSGMYDVFSTTNNLFYGVLTDFQLDYGKVENRITLYDYRTLPENANALLQTSYALFGFTVNVKANHTYSWNDPITFTPASGDYSKIDEFLYATLYEDYESAGDHNNAIDEQHNLTCYTPKYDGVLFVAKVFKSANGQLWTVNEGSDLIQINEGSLQTYQRPAFAHNRGSVNFTLGSELYN